MRIPTKTVATLLIVTMLTVALPSVNATPSRARQPKHRLQFDRLLQRHDRKGELRAEVLGIDALTFREKQKRLAFDEILRQSGFKSIREFRIALIGRLKNELHARGWSLKKIEHYVMTRSPRIG